LPFIDLNCVLNLPDYNLSCYPEIQGTLFLYLQEKVTLPITPGIVLGVL
jgi:hypothetical protein